MSGIIIYFFERHLTVIIKIAEIRLTMVSKTDLITL